MMPTFASASHSGLFVFVLAAWLYYRSRVTLDRGALPATLCRRNQGRALLGLCAGMAEYFGVATWLVRALVVALALVFPHVPLAYLVLGMMVRWHSEDAKSFLTTRLINLLKGRLARANALA